MHEHEAGGPRGRRLPPAVVVLGRSAMGKPMQGIIQRWGITWFHPTDGDPFYCVVGEQHYEGALVRTSEIVAIRDDATGNKLLETRNSFYQLVGEPDHEYAMGLFRARYGEG